MNSGTGLSILQKAMPERYFDVGIAEQQAILFASGLALEGVKPVAAIYSTFLQRAYDQIVHDVCLQKLNVVFAMDRAGLVGDDGPTHHGAFDIAYLRCLPNIVLMAPRDEAMLVHMLRTALVFDGPIALRYPRGEGTGVALPAGAAADRDRHGRDPARGRRRRNGRAARRADRLRQRRRQGARRRRGAGRARHLGDGRRRALCQADRRRPDGPAGRRARPAGDRRGGRAGRRLRLGRLGDAQRDRRHRRASCASACPTATSRTASRRCCTRRSASRPSASPSASSRRSPTARRRSSGLERARAALGPPPTRHRARPPAGTPPSGLTGRVGFAFSQQGDRSGRHDTSASRTVRVRLK